MTDRLRLGSLALDRWMSRWGGIVVAVAGAAAVLLALLATRGLTAPPERDEIVFLQVTDWIARRGFGVEAFRTYPHQSPPLFYALIGLARRFAGDGDLPLLRGLILIGGASVVWGLGRRECRRSPAALLPLLVFPYFIFGSGHLYSDVPMLACGIWGWWSFQRRRFVLAGLLWTLAIGFRQFGLLFPAAAGAMMLFLSPAELLKVRPAFAIVAPVLVLGGLCLFWGGLVPDSPVRPEIAALGMPLPEVLSYSIVCFGAYVAPFVALWWLAGRRKVFRAEIVVAVVSLAFFFCFPPRPNRWWEIRDRAETYWMLGYLDRAATWLLGPARIYLFAVLFFAGCLAILNLLHPLGPAWKARRAGIIATAPDPESTALVFHACVLMAFLLLNLGTFIAWDKYLLPVLPSACALLAASDRRHCR